ncbi:predicted protein [Plenodomus lingam JN3]|uniref:Predicted protein n=1 Tax=Leptosphaeria maculans (strain JN3 / isolate v23.1.3 / race Av1-4-5-6-7-8) TaxID=985895 RepID=E5A8L5_LEPMJ|nr:predicted protein [Plenodomus lingam JN3]CBX99960.1 predicted protein [Plenodomus lingam JN3]
MCFFVVGGHRYCGHLGSEAVSKDGDSEDKLFNRVVQRSVKLTAVVHVGKTGICKLRA